MFVGMCKIKLHIDSSYSLKDKRNIVKSILDRVKSKFNVSAAEVGLNELWNQSIIGIVCVSNDAKHTDAMIQSIVNFIDNDPRLEITDCLTETSVLK